MCNSHKLSFMLLLIVNWVRCMTAFKNFRRFMRQGITVFLDVPLDALARRIAAVGTDSRPLLDYDSADSYTKVAFICLFEVQYHTSLQILTLPLQLCTGIYGTVCSFKEEIRGICKCWCYRFSSQYVLSLCIAFACLWSWFLLRSTVVFCSMFICMVPVIAYVGRDLPSGFNNSLPLSFFCSFRFCCDTH